LTCKKCDELRAALDNAETASGAAYQALGSLTDDFGIFEHPLIQRLLTVLSRQEEHDGLLPWPSKEPREWVKEASEAPPSDEHIQLV
jgi:hypothetical protein